MLSGEPFASAVFPFAPPVSRTVWGWLLMKPATSTKLALFCCYFYSTAGAVMQVFFYKTVTFWGCVDEVTEFRCCFWLFCTIEMGRRASAASPQGDQLAGRYRGERSEPAEGSACGEVPGRAQRARREISLRGEDAPPRARRTARGAPRRGAPAAFAAAGRRGLLRRAGNQKADPLQMRESAKNHSWCRIMRAHL